MDLDTFIVATYCLIDDLMRQSLGGRRLRQRGPDPILDDREVITMEVVGEFLGMDTDKAIFLFFRRHYPEWFPAVGRVHRTTFARQAANLWAVKELMWESLSARVAHDEAGLFLVDSFAVPVCSFAKAPRHKSFAGIASYGHDAMSKSFFYGVEGHLRVRWPGVIVGAALAPADIHDRWVAEYDLLGGVEEGSVVLADTNYASPTLRESLAAYGVSLLAPKRPNRKRDRHPWPRWLTNMRRRIETVISQLVERYSAKRVRARDLWHLSSRWWRKILSHTLCVRLCQEAGLSTSLRFSELLSH
ncbi:MAG TPA: IS982 family transposase [Rubrobacter sp.]|nr:IS982 family transposase [Rubrobacter sp.]